MTLAELAAQHRAAILARDQALADQISYHYYEIWQKIFWRLQQLTQQIGDAQDNGDEVKLSWLFEQNRLQLFLGQVSQEIGLFADYAQMQTLSQLHLAAQIGAQDALSLLEHQLGEVVGSFNRLPAEAIHQAVYNVENDAHLKKLFGSFDDQTVDAVKKRLILAVALGENPRQIASDIQQALKIPLNRALMIARTESINAYRDTSIETYRANADVVRGWTWSAAPGACPECAAMDGTHHDLSENMDGLHPNCRCAALPDTVSYDQILSEVA